MKEQKCLNLGLKMPYLGIFGLKFLKAVVIFEISTLKFVTNESLIHTLEKVRGGLFSDLLPIL